MAMADDLAVFRPALLFGLDDRGFAFAASGRRRVALGRQWPPATGRQSVTGVPGFDAGFRCIGLKQPVLGRILHDDVGRVGQIEHGAGAFVEGIGVEPAGAQAGDAAFPGVAVGFGTGKFGAGLFQQILALGGGFEAVVALGGVPAEIANQGKKDHRGDYAAGAAFQVT